MKITGIHKRSIKRTIKPLSARTAAIYALYITLLIYLLFMIMLVYGRNAVIPADHHHGPPMRPEFDFGMLILGIIHTYVYCFLLFLVNFRILRNDYDNGVKTAICILATLLVVVVWNSLWRVAQMQVLDIPPPDPRAMRGGFARDLLLAGLVLFSSEMLNLSYRRQQMALENEAIKAEYERARYETLKNQIDPHFLFNTLNTLISVISTDPGKAQEYVQKLSAVFRYTMQNRETTTLEQELDFTRDYCALMQIRYGDSLRFEFEIEQRYVSYDIVPFSIQTLVENAIKHNVISNRQPLTVTVATAADDTVTVSNPVNPKKEPEAGGGIGLANLAERYRLKWDKEVLITENDGIFSVRLPLVSMEKE